MTSQNIAESPLNITSILNNFKSFIKQVYQKEWTQNINKKNDENNYFRAEISQKQEKLLTFKEKKQIEVSLQGKFTFFLKFNFYKSKFANTYMSYDKLATIFDINTFKLL